MRRLYHSEVFRESAGALFFATLALAMAHGSYDALRWALPQPGAPLFLHCELFLQIFVGVGVWGTLNGFIGYRLLTNIDLGPFRDQNSPVASVWAHVARAVAFIAGVAMAIGEFIPMPLLWLGATVGGLAASTVCAWLALRSTRARPARRGHLRAVS